MNPSSWGSEAFTVVSVGMYIQSIKHITVQALRWPMPTIGHLRATCFDLSRLDSLSSWPGFSQPCLSVTAATRLRFPGSLILHWTCIRPFQIRRSSNSASGCTYFVAFAYFDDCIRVTHSRPIERRRTPGRNQPHGFPLRRQRTPEVTRRNCQVVEGPLAQAMGAQRQLEGRS